MGLVLEAWWGAGLKGGFHCAGNAWGSAGRRLGSAAHTRDSPQNEGEMPSPPPMGGLGAGGLGPVGGGAGAQVDLDFGGTTSHLVG